MLLRLQYIFLWLLLGATTSAVAQTNNSPAKRFLHYYNTHQKDSLELLLSDDFIFNRSFVKDSLAGKQDFLGSFMRYYAAFNSQYEALHSIYDTTTTTIIALDRNNEVKFLQLTPASWKLTIQTKGDKVTSFRMGATAHSGAYFNELIRKTKLFRKWASTKYGNSILNKIDGDVATCHQLMEEYYDRHPLEYHFVPAKSANGMPCSHFGKLLLKQRLALYPFSKAASVVLVSFTDTLRYADYVSLEKRFPDFTAVKDKKKLSAADIDKLSDLLFNVGYDTKEIFVTELSACPSLKHAIVFLNAKGEPFDYIGVFWTCYALEYNVNKISLPEACYDKLGLLKRFFLERGVSVTGVREQ